MSGEVNADFELELVEPFRIIVDKGIAVPPVQTRPALSYNKQLSALNVGDSFLVPEKQIDSINGLVSKWNSTHGKVNGHKIIRRRIALDAWRFFKVKFKVGEASHYR